MASKRFTAVVKIIEIEETTVRAAHTRNEVPVETNRELIDIEVRAKDLDSMKSKLKAHIDLAEEL